METGVAAQRSLSNMPFAPVHLGNRGQQSKRQICSNSTTGARGRTQETDYPKHGKATHRRQEDNPGTLRTSRMAQVPRRNAGTSELAKA